MKKRNKVATEAEAIRREEEIKKYGKLLSLRPSKAFDSKKQYKRCRDKFNKQKDEN